MTIKYDIIGDVTIAMMPMEELDVSNSWEFKRDITPILEGTTKLVFDMGGLRFVDSSGMGVLISCLRKMKAKGGDAKLYGMSKQVHTVFELMRMHRIFDIYGTKEEAALAFAQ